MAEPGQGRHAPAPREPRAGRDGQERRPLEPAHELLQVFRGAAAGGLPGAGGRGKGARHHDRRRLRGLREDEQRRPRVREGAGRREGRWLPHPRRLPQELHHHHGLPAAGHLALPAGRPPGGLGHHGLRHRHRHRRAAEPRGAAGGAAGDADRLRGRRGAEARDRHALRAAGHGARAASAAAGHAAAEAQQQARAGGVQELLLQRGRLRALGALQRADPGRLRQREAHALPQARGAGVRREPGGGARGRRVRAD
mmetsp:Transcript_58941/g.189562  ORF Transcript_58941/g.189562 Transcript_58941/m.189562 type:complete len:254 (-) Transcript_58941:2495-3256(-)